MRHLELRWDYSGSDPLDQSEMHELFVSTTNPCLGTLWVLPLPSTPTSICYLNRADAIWTTRGVNRS
jgi:hypothetical protein